MKNFLKLKVAALAFTALTHTTAFAGDPVQTPNPEMDKAAMMMKERNTALADAVMKKDLMMANDKMMAKTLTSGTFTRKQKRIKGSYEVVRENGQTLIRFGEDFETVNGPDLKVFLSPQSITTASGKNATQNAVLLGFVKSKSGAQDYVLPADVDIADFNSVLVHCEAFSVLWGGGTI